MAADKSSWMSTLSDDLHIADINIPGTHDSVAINHYFHTPYACHRSTLETQLISGIRLFDIRIKVKKKGSAYIFVTCHGNISLGLSINEYQTLDSVFVSFSDFLQLNKTEALFVTLKIDDWNGYATDKPRVFDSLYTLIIKYNSVIKDSGYYTAQYRLRYCRGKITLLNRMNTSIKFGIPIAWEDNTPGSYDTEPSYKTCRVYVQDKYRKLDASLPKLEKLDLVTKAFKAKKPGEIVLNFASATRFLVFGVYIMKNLVSFFGSKSLQSRPGNFGWLLLDYELTSYKTDIYGCVNIIDIIISSNFNYAGYDKQFKVYRFIRTFRCASLKRNIGFKKILYGGFIWNNSSSYATRSSMS